MNRHICFRLRFAQTAAAMLLGASANAAMIGGGYNIDGGDPVTSGQGFFTAPNGDVVKIVDGLTGNSWLPNSGPPITATIDLGRVYRLTDLNLTNSTFSLRATDGFNVTASTTGAFGGEQSTLVSGNMPLPGAGTADVAIATNQVGRYVRFTGTSVYPGHFNGGIAEISLGGVPNRATAQLASTTPFANSVSAKAFTSTTALTDAAATWSLSSVTPTSGSIVQSLGKSVITSPKDFGDPSTVTDGINTAPGTTTTGELLFSQTPHSDLSFGYATVDLGQRMIIDQISVQNTTFNGNASKNYIIRVANNLTDFDDPSYTDLLTSNFAAVNEVDSFTLGAAVIGRYVRFVAIDFLSPGVPRAGLDELTVTGRTFTTSLLASGSGAIGDSSNLGNIALGSSLAGQFNLLTLDVNTPDGLNRQILQQVEVLPEPSSVAGALLGILWLRRPRHSRRRRM